MEISSTSGIIAISVGVALIIIVVIFFWPRRHLCQQCKTKKTHRQEKKDVYICRDCHYDNLLLEEKPVLFCPHDGKKMEKRLLKEPENIVVHVCPDPQCQTVVINNKALRQIAVMPVKFYFPKKQSETKVA